MAESKIKKDVVAAKAEQFRRGGDIFISNLDVPVQKAKALHEESQSPATLEILEMCQKIAKEGPGAKEAMANFGNGIEDLAERAIKAGLA